MLISTEIMGYMKCQTDADARRCVSIFYGRAMRAIFLLRHVVVTALWVLVASCGGGGGPATSDGSGSLVPLFTTAPSAVTIRIGGITNYTIGGGIAPYSVSSSDTGMVKAEVSGKVLTIQGLSAGSLIIQMPVQLIISDSKGNTVKVSVSVAYTEFFITAPSTLMMGLSSMMSYVIGGGTAPYTVTNSDATIVKGSVSGTELTVIGAAEGTASVVVFDSDGRSASTRVTVSPSTSMPLVVIPSTVAANVGDVLNFRVSGASPPYTVKVNNISIATASVQSVANSGDTFTIALNSVGETTVDITDKLMQTTKLSLTAIASATTIRLSPSAIIVGEDYSGSLTFKIFGGTGPYSALTDNLVLTGVPSAQLGSSALTVGLGIQGSRCIDSIDRTDPTAPIYIPYGTVPVTLTVKDDSTGATATAIINVKDNGVSRNGGCTIAP